jgi:hypothetical protein
MAPFDSLAQARPIALAASLLTLAAVGCVSLSEQAKTDPFRDKEKKKAESSLLDRLPWAGKKTEEVVPYPNPVKIAATWTPDTLIQTGRTPTRGFGGRVFFYDEKTRPVPVEGTLIVHGFDDSADTPEKSVKRFEFTPEQFTRHFAQTDLGASYSVWIPWDAVGGPQRRIALVASFQPAEGNIVQGVPATFVLPGSTVEADKERIAAMFSPDYRRHRAATESGSTRTSGLTTTTIRRRGAAPSVDVTKPGIIIPTTRPQKSMLAEQPTPSFDLEMPKQRSRPTVLPASANMPIRK